MPAPQPTHLEALTGLEAVLESWPVRMVACSGGIDSLLLATVAHRLQPSSTVVAHAVTPAVPSAATARVRRLAHLNGWSLTVVSPAEFGDDRYLANPVDRCYYCKDHLYSSLEALTARLGTAGTPLLSGANQDDLGDYRPGLAAAAEHGVHHPFVEAGIGKAGIRAMARHLNLDFAELPASPCLASRLYTGTRVTPSRLRAVEAAEALISSEAGVSVVRCRLRQSACLIEVEPADRASITPTLLHRVWNVVRQIEPAIESVALDDHDYRPGRAIVLN